MWHLVGSMPQTCPGPSSHLSLLSPAGRQDYDLLVIGGGSGGLACAKEGMYPVPCVLPAWQCLQVLRAPRKGCVVLEAGWRCTLSGYAEAVISVAGLPAFGSCILPASPQEPCQCALLPATLWLSAQHPGARMVVLACPPGLQPQTTCDRLPPI